MNTRKKLVLFDGNAVFHRAYHAIPPSLTNQEGLPTNAVYGFTNILLKALTELKPDYAVVAWDKRGGTFRNRLYPEYKATRKQQPDDLYQQMPLAREVVDALSLQFVDCADYEADDVIGTLAAQAKDLETVIVTGDMDELQLVNDHTKVYTMQRGFTTTTIYDLDAVRERYHMTPEQFIDLKALKGDTSDNIPGVSGVGEKTAMNLIQQYGSLDNLYKHVDEVKGKLQENLRKEKDIAYLSRKLSVIVCDAPVTLDLEAARMHKYDRDKVEEVFHRLNFRSLLAKLPVGPKLATSGTPSLFDEMTEAPTARPVNGEYKGIQTKAELDALIKLLADQESFAFDTETTSVDVIEAELVGMSFSCEKGVGYYIPVGHQEGKQLDRDMVVATIKPLLEDAKIGKVGHNIKYDYEIMHKYGVRLSPITFDTMIGAFIINPLGRSQTLDELAYSELNVEMIPITALIGASGKGQKSFDQTKIEDAIQYASEDADISWRLYQKLEPQLAPIGAVKLADDIEWPLIPVLADMELAGIALDVPFLKKFDVKISARILKLEEEIYKLSGEHFNISSPAQLAHVLYDKLGLSVPGIKKGKTGLSTAAAELEKLRGAHPIVESLSEYRELVKLKSTYVEALPQMVSPVDHRIHTSFSQTIAQTGRLSSSNPNLQNIPIRTEIGREIRKAFVAKPGHAFISADYSQFELRIAAALSHDEGMIKAFISGGDVHLQTAAELFNLPADQITKEQRHAAKTINFGVLYGMSAHGLSVATGMSREEAAEFIQRYFALRPALSEYVEKIKQDARKNAYAATLFGRRRPLGEINSNNHIIAAAAERMAVNVPIQGTQAELMKMAMIQLAPKLKADSRMLLQIHDELIIETPKDTAEEVAAFVKKNLEDVYDIGVPLVVDTSVGPTWGALD